MDHRGAKVEDEGMIGVPLAAPFAFSRKPKIRKFILDKPFWVVMKRKNSQHPYFVVGVKNIELIKK
jgi:hypothetical protein